jgi:hypothetical protein
MEPAQNTADGPRIIVLDKVFGDSGPDEVRVFVDLEERTSSVSIGLRLDKH